MRLNKCVTLAYCCLWLAAVQAACPDYTDFQDGYLRFGDAANISFPPRFQSVVSNSPSAMAQMVVSASQAANSNWSYVPIGYPPSYPEVPGFQAAYCMQLFIDGTEYRGNIFFGCGWGDDPYKYGAYFTTRGVTLCPDGYQLGNTGMGAKCIKQANTSICTDREKNGGEPEVCQVGNPINPSTGSKFFVETDYQANGSLLVFRRYYYQDERMAMGTFVTSTFSLGANWSHSFEQNILRVSTYRALVQRADGKKYRFSWDGFNWKADADVPGTLTSTRDDNGTVLSWQYLTREDVLEQYDASGKLINIQKGGEVLRFTYINQSSSLEPAGAPMCDNSPGVLPQNNKWRLRCVTDLKGRQLNFKYDSLGRIAGIVDPSGGTIGFAYDEQSNLTSVTRQDSARRQYLYNEPEYSGGAILFHALTGIIDENGSRYATYGYDSTGRAISTEHAGGVAKYNLTYNGDGTTQVVDPLGTQRLHSFETVLGVMKDIARSQPGGAGCSASGQARTYDANGNVASRTDFNGNVTTFSYDLSRNLETQRVEAWSKPESRTISTQWHVYWRLPTALAEPKKLSTFIYNGDTWQGSVVSCAPAGAVVPATGGGTRPIGVLCKKIEQSTNDINGAQGFGSSSVGTPRVWSYTYDLYGRLLAVDGPRTDVADVTTYTYYDLADPDPGKRGALATITNALGHVTQFTAYDAAGYLLTIVDANGERATLAYDSRHRLTSRTTGGDTTSYQYDDVDQLTKITLPDGSAVTYSYDGAHRLTGISDSLGNRIIYTLDAIGNRVKEEVRDPSGQLTRVRQRVFDALSRLTQDIGAQNQVTAYEYDSNGNRTKVTSPQSQITVSAYDALNRLVQITDSGQGQTRYSWDGQEQFAQITDPRSLSTTYLADGLGNRLQLQSPDTGVTGSSYDAAGNELTRRDAKGQLSSFQYDALNRQTRATYADGRDIVYTWDVGTNGMGRLGRIDESQTGTPVGSLAWAYDTQGRVIAETRTVGSVSHTVGYAWSAGQLAGVTLPSGRQLTYARNAAGQVTQISLTESGQIRVLADGVTYAPFGGVTGWTDGAGQVHSRTYDQDGRVVSYTLGGKTWLVTYDPAGRISGQVDGTDAANSAVYGYDALDRLTNATLPATAYGYGYDATGNRTSQSLGASNRPYTVDAASNRLLAVGTAPPTSYAYDANGSVTQDGTATYGYDARGRLVQASSAAGTTAYAINALGQRVRKSSPVGDTIYAYDTAGHLIAESDAAGHIQREVVWLGNTPIAVLQ